MKKPLYHNGFLYTELKEYVEKIIVRDPYRNKLLTERAKTDKIDAKKLVSGYEDVPEHLHRLKAQSSRQ